MPKTLRNYQLILLAVVITVAIFFRFWQLKDYVVFLGDEGRDMIVMRNIFTEKKLPFLGPTASVGGFYLGPIYYWMAAPFLFLWHFDPVGPSYFVAVIGVLTVFLLYKFIKEAVGFWPAILASSLYAVAPLVVRYSRSSWNPNPLPFFALLMIYFIYRGIRKKKNLHFIGAGASLGIAIQLHYLASILIAIGTLIILLNTNFQRWLKIALFSIIGFLITFSPFLLFEAKHNFPNFNTIFEFVTRGTTTGFASSNLIWIVSNLGNIFLEEIANLKGTIFTRIAFWFLALTGLIGLYLHRNDKEKRLVISISLIWFIVGLLGLRFYAGQIFDYYFGFMFVSPFVLSGLVFSLLWKNIYLKIVVAIFAVLTFAIFVSRGFHINEPNRLINQTENIANFVIEKTQGEPYNFALISEGNSDHAYRYFLEPKGHRPTELETLITDQLLIVCESKNCSPLGHPLWEIAGFGRAEITGEWELKEYGIKIFRLTHWPGEPSPAGKPAVKGG